MKLKDTYCGHNMEEHDDKPILLVSARNKEAAAYIITEIIHSENEDVGASQIEEHKLECVWKIINKYYSADVWVHPLLDGDTLGAEIADRVEAHVIYLTNEECNTESAVETMQRRAPPGEAAHVRLAVADVYSDPPALAAACADSRLELVSLREAGAEGDERGAARVRAALHAHLWPGLQHRGRTDLSVRSQEEASETPETSDDEWSEWCEAPANGNGVTGTEEEFFAALATLPEAAAAVRRGGGGEAGGGGGGGVGREERLRRAEELVAAFCRALGTPFD